MLFHHGKTNVNIDGKPQQSFAALGAQKLSGPIEPDAQQAALAEQLARINEQFVIKNQHSKRVCKTIGIIAACIIVANILFVGLMLLFSYSAYESYENTIVTKAAEQIIE